jgi:hypothetical protein
MSAATLAAEKHRAAARARILQLNKEAWIAQRIVPDVVTAVPVEPANISWGPRQSPCHCHIGQELTPSIVASPPVQFHWASRPSSYYTLLCLDPDVPSAKDTRFRSFLHWAVGNVLGEEITRGDTLAEYVGACPAEDAGTHRYVFLVYDQGERKAEFKGWRRLKATSYEGREGFHAEKFVERFSGGQKWTLVGGNFYSARFDESVPALHAQLRGEEPVLVIKPQSRSTASSAAASDLQPLPTTSSTQ